MKTFKIRASANATYDEVLIRANTKSEAEEKFRKKCRDGEIPPTAIEFKDVAAASSSQKEMPKGRANLSDGMPVEVWDSISLYDYYASKGYDVLRAHQTKPQYLYSRKEKLVGEYLHRLDGLTEEDVLKCYPKGAIIGDYDKDRVREIVAAYILEETKKYASGFGTAFNWDAFRPKIENKLSRMPKAIDRIIADDRKKLDGLIQAYNRERGRQSKISADALEKFLKDQNIDVRKPILDELMKKINAQKKRT